MKQKFKSQKSFDDVKGSSDKEPRVEDLVDLYKFPAKQWVQVRFVGPLVSYGRHWIETKKLDGSKTKFPKTCLSYDPETEEHDSTKACPWCDAEDARISFGPEFYQNAIIREIEEDGPSKKAAKQSKSEGKTGIKDRGSKAWTPVRVVRLTGSMIREIKKLGGLNRHKNKKTGEKKAFSVSHVKYGCDISIQYDPDEKVTSKKYSFQKGDASALSEEQQEYLMYQIEDMMHPDKKKDAQEDMKRWLEKMGKKKSKGKDSDDDDSDDDEDDSDDDDDDDDEDEKPKGKSKSKGKDKKKAKSKDDDDEDDDDLPEEDDDDEDEDEDEKPKGKSKKSKSKKSDDEDEDDDDLDDEDDSDSDDDEDEDEKPKGKSKSKGKDKKKAKKSSKDDDDDLDDEDELDDDDSDGDDDDTDGDDDDEDEKPKGKGKKGKDKKKAKKSDDDDEDDDLDDDLDDDDDEDEDEKPKGKSKSKGKDKKKAKSKKKSKSDEDDDEDD